MCSRAHRCHRHRHLPQSNLHASAIRLDPVIPSFRTLPLSMVDEEGTMDGWLVRLTRRKKGKNGLVMLMHILY